ncbi:MAG: hypothetical protein IJV05_05745 [Muribaculaceae bacterium]|nr:hypothetical protein [Muribaculaceae bacterium]
MKYILILFICWGFLVLSIPLAAQVQDSTDVDTYVTQLNAQCPIDFTDGWGVNSFTMVGDRYALVDIKTPSNLSMILSSISSGTDNVKRLWIRQLKQYGDRWNRFVDRMVDADLRIILNLHPEGSRETALIIFYPSDFKTE